MHDPCLYESGSRVQEPAVSDDETDLGDYAASARIAVADGPACPGSLTMPRNAIDLLGTEKINRMLLCNKDDDVCCVLVVSLPVVAGVRTAKELAEEAWLWKQRTPPPKSLVWLACFDCQHSLAVTYEPLPCCATYHSRWPSLMTRLSCIGYQAAHKPDQRSIAV